MASRQEKQRRRELAKAAEERQGPRFETRVGIDSWRDVLAELDDHVMPMVHAFASGSSRFKSLFPEAGVLAAAGSMRRPPVSEDVLLAAERRLGLELPPTYRAFLTVSDGLQLPLYCRFEGADGIRSFAELGSIEYTYFEDNGEYPNVEDPEYFTYGKDQDGFCIRPEYLRSALALNSAGCKELGWCLLVRDVRFPTGEHEIWDFGAWGSNRYRSFADYFGVARIAIVESLGSFEDQRPRPSLP